MKKALLTRPAGKNDQLKMALVARDMPVMEVPLFTRELFPLSLDYNGVQAIFLSSANGCADIDVFPDLPVFAVGEATAEVARQKGAKQVFIGANKADSLLDMAHEKLDPAKGVCLYLRGEQIAYPLAEALKGAGFSVQEIISYRMEPLDGFPPILLKSLQKREIGHIFFFSAYAAQHFMSLQDKTDMRESCRETVAYAISSRVADVLKTGRFLAVHIAQNATTEGLLSAFDAEQQHNG